jgi:hypothetical protein
MKKCVPEYRLFCIEHEQRSFSQFSMLHCSMMLGNSFIICDNILIFSEVLIIIGFGNVHRIIYLSFFVPHYLWFRKALNINSAAKSNEATHSCWCDIWVNWTAKYYPIKIIFKSQKQVADVIYELIGQRNIIQSKSYSKVRSKRILAG